MLAVQQRFMTILGSLSNDKSCFLVLKKFYLEEIKKNTCNVYVLTIDKDFFAITCFNKEISHANKMFSG